MVALRNATREWLRTALYNPLEGKFGDATISFIDRTAGQTFDFIGAPNAIAKAWCDPGSPVIRVQRDYSGAVQDLYPTLNGTLYTQAFGQGTTATDFAGGDLLLVDRIYNQAGSDPSSDFITAISDDRRVLLNLDITTSPTFAGYSTGTQHPSQNATERGYELPDTITLQTNDHVLSTIAVYQHATTGDDVRLVQQDVNGNPYWRVQANPSRHFPTWAIVVHALNQSDVPTLIQQWALDDYSDMTYYSQRVGHNGVYYDGAAQFTGTATSSTLNIFGPVGSLRGICSAILIAENSLSAESMLFGGFPTLLAPLYAGRIADDKPSVSFPYANAVIPMDLSTETADIPVKLVGKPSTEYEVSWQGAGYVSVGTTDADGVLNGSLTGQSKGNGTWSIREVGRTTPVSFTNVAVGIVVYAMGESGADGRGDNVTITIPTGSLRKDRANWTAASNEWWKLFLQNLYDKYTCVIGVTKVAAGSTYFRLNPSTRGMWAAEPARVGVGSMQGSNFALGLQTDFLTPNYWIWDIGKNDAALATSGADFETEFAALFDAYTTRLNNSNIKFNPVVIGQNDGIAAARTDAIREVTIDLWDQNAGFDAAGSFAHLPAGSDDIHFETQAQKQAAADVVMRNLEGAGRAPQFSSVAVNSADLDIVFTGGVSPLTIDSAAESTGWTISDGAGARTVSNVAISGMTVTLTCDQALTGTVNIIWCSDNTGIGTTLNDSDATTPLPPEPFSTSVAA